MRPQVRPFSIAARLGRPVRGGGGMTGLRSFRFVGLGSVAC